MKDYRIEIRVKNARLYDAIHAKFKSISEFCDSSGIDKVSVYELVSMRIEARSPSTGRWRTSAQRVCDALGEFPDDMFNERQQFGKQLESVRAISISEHEIGLLQSHESEPEIIAQDESIKRAVGAAISGLKNKRHRLVVSMFMQDKTHEEIGRELDIGRCRVQQILDKSLRQFRKTLDARDFDFTNYDEPLDERIKKRRYMNFPSWKDREEQLAEIGGA